MARDLAQFAEHETRQPPMARAPVRGRQSTPCDPVAQPPNAELLARWGASRALRLGVLPWRRVGGRVVVLACAQNDFDAAEPELRALFGPVARGLCTQDRLRRAIELQARGTLVHQAETLTPAAYSCRSHNTARFRNWALAVISALLAALISAPSSAIFAISALSLGFVLINIAFKTLASLAALRRGPVTQPPALDDEGDLPRLSILVPLHKEANIATHLLRRLARLRYPRSKLELCLVVEQKDDCTRNAIAALTLPPWISTVVVPPGSCTTKPRAMNYALDFIQGDIVGIFDAEDAPDPDQLLTVARHFNNAPNDVACVQGVLDYYNTGTNWLSRCFTIEYASWFRVMLAGIEQLGLVIPLGGTTLYIRRDVLERLGAWDAQNVTEDADLGVRLARAGYRTAMIPTTTEEEANARLWPWIKQRSRWLKGYAITYLVHMRRPRQLYADLGARRFWGLQVQFANTLCAVCFAPVIWSLWLKTLGVAHPFFTPIPGPVLLGMTALFFAAQAMNFAVNCWGAVRAGKPSLILWAPTMILYYPLATFALYKGLYELAHKPFYWDKTAHGIFTPSKAP